MASIGRYKCEQCLAWTNNMPCEWCGYEPKAEEKPEPEETFFRAPPGTICPRCGSDPHGTNEGRKSPRQSSTVVTGDRQGQSRVIVSRPYGESGDCDRGIIVSGELWGLIEYQCIECGLIFTNRDLDAIRRRDATAQE